MKYLIAIHLTVLILFSSCNKDITYNSEICDDLSMKFFRGLPKPSKQFKDNCGSIKVTYTQEKCKAALKDLMLGGDEERLKKKFGSKIMGCFNQGDLDKFLNKSQN